MSTNILHLQIQGHGEANQILYIHVFRPNWNKDNFFSNNQQRLEFTLKQHQVAY